MDDLSLLTDEELRQQAAALVKLASDERKDNQLMYFQPVSDTAARVFESDARVFGIGGGNRCLALESRVLMADGSWKELGQIRVGDFVMAADPSTGESVPAPVLRTWRAGKKPVYRIEFSDGGSFEASEDHIVPLYLGSGRKTSKGNAKVAHKRRIGDYIAPIMRRGATNPSKRIAAVSPKDIQFLETKLPLPPYLLGALLGDGSITRNIKFSSADKCVIDRVRAEVELMGCKLTKYKQYDYGIGGTKTGYGQNHVMNALRKLGLWGTNSYTKFIPREAFGLSREDRMQLLAGLIDTDGTANAYSTCSKQLAEDVAHLVRTLGGKATISERMARCQNGVSVKTYCLYVRLNDRIPISLSRKQLKNSKREVDYTKRVCRSATLVGEKECGDITVDHPEHCYITGDYVIVSNSGKTDQCLALISACCTGIFPDSMKHVVARRFRGPIRVRIICDSLTTTLYPTILPKLQWWQWSGADRPGGERGHWGWIPPYCLKERSWEKSWSEKLRILTLICRDPKDPNIVLGESIIHFMSYDQEEGRGTDFHIILHDEPPPLHIWRESEARVMGVAGRLLVAMTWPDDPSIPVDWIFDEVYEPGISGQRKDIEWVNIYSTDNRNVDQDAIAAQAKNWSEETRKVRILGQPIRFSNRVHPLFTDTSQHWCHACKKSTLTNENPEALNEYDKLICIYCNGTNVTEYNHVQEFDASSSWPTVFLLDPHPRKPHRCLWIMVDPADDYWVVDELDCEGDPVDLKQACDEIESRHNLRVALRLIDPNMGRSPSSSRRGITWQDDFEAVGLACELADDSDTGRKHLNQYMKPDDRTLRPRIMFHPRVKLTINDIKRYVWDEHKRAAEKDLKQIPKQKYDDSPALLKYHMNYLPTFNGLSGMHRVFSRGGAQRRGAY